jgi:hypothetical protein
MRLNKNKKIALYLLWTFLNTILFLTSGNFLARYDSDFYPFPLYKTFILDTYQYTIYNKINEYYSDIPSFEDYIKLCKTSKSRLQKIWLWANQVGYYVGDSNVTLQMKMEFPKFT